MSKLVNAFLKILWLYRVIVHGILMLKLFGDIDREIKKTKSKKFDLQDCLM